MCGTGVLAAGAGVAAGLDATTGPAAAGPRPANIRQAKNIAPIMIVAIRRELTVRFSLYRRYKNLRHTGVLQTGMRIFLDAAGSIGQIESGQNRSPLAES